MCILGRFSRFLPEDFETTGITLLIAISNVGIIGGNLIAGQQLDWFDVHPGYFQRIVIPMLINISYSVLVMFLVPVFLSRNLTRNKLKSVKGLNDTRINSGDSKEEKY